MRHAFLSALVAVVLLLGAPTSTAVAQDSAEGVPARIAVIDINHIRENALAMQDIKNQIQAFGVQFRDELKKEEEALRTASQDLARQRAILAPDVFAEERRKFEQQIGSTRRDVQRRQLQIERVHNDARKVVQAALNQVIIELAREFEITLILRKDQTVLVASQFEMTEEALKRLNARLKTVKVASPDTVK